jgi:hypothetical protein
MKICYKCNREITNAERVVLDGIKYKCATEEDQSLCFSAVKQMELEAKMKEQEELSTNPEAHTCQHCSNKFLHWILLETYPATYKCPLCKRVNNVAIEETKETA